MLEQLGMDCSICDHGEEESCFEELEVLLNSQKHHHQGSSNFIVRPSLSEVLSSVC